MATFASRPDSNTSLRAFVSPSDYLLDGVVPDWHSSRWSVVRAVRVLSHCCSELRTLPDAHGRISPKDDVVQDFDAQ